MTTVLNKNNFAAFILTHGRPNKVVTWEQLRKQGYTGKIYLILDSEDQTINEYRKKFGADNIIVFDKKNYEGTFDTADNQTTRRGVIYARNANFDIAAKLGLDYFLQLDDDYNSFRYRHVKNGQLKSINIKNLDKTFKTMLTLLEDTKADSVAMSQGGDHIGGIGGKITHRPIDRKVMNSFFFKTNNPQTFIGRINEDVNLYVLEGTRGKLFFTVMATQLNQVQTQLNSGGMTELYLDNGTYVKSFYSVVISPSNVKIKAMGTTHRRFHHSVKWANTVPVIISGKHKKQ
jgi:hypothetical protein